MGTIAAILIGYVAMRIALKIIAIIEGGKERRRG